MLLDDIIDSIQDGNAIRKIAAFTKMPNEMNRKNDYSRLAVMHSIER